MAAVLVYAVALFFALMGLAALIRPGWILAPFGIHSLGSDGRNEVRAVYGGFGLTIAGLLVLAPEWPGLRVGILLTVGVALCGMAAGRVIGGFTDRRIGFFPALFLGVELLLAAALFLAAREWA